MAYIWNIGVAKIDHRGNLFLDGGIAYNGDASVSVQNATTDVGRFSNLVSAYASAKLLTPNGSSLANDNRAVVIIPPGIYDAGTSTLNLDANYVDLVAQVPQTGTVAFDGNDIDQSSYNPPCTVITGAPVARGGVISQDVDNVRLMGFAIVSTSTLAPLYHTTDAGGDESIYEKMYLWADDFGIDGNYTDINSTYAKHVDGTWIDCISHDWAWRVQYATPQDSMFRAKMYRCTSGYKSVGGDTVALTLGTSTFEGAYLEGCIASSSAFGGCTTWGIAIDSDTTFVECECINGRGFGLGNTCSGTFIRCRGGDGCCGSTFNDTYPGEFNGYAEDCTFGAGSLGGRTTSITEGKCSGELVRCVVTENLESLHVETATIRDSIITSRTSGIDGITLLDSGSKIIGSTIEVFTLSTDVPINAGSALNVIATGCVFNNGDNDADGLGANVTNLATTAGNGVY